MEIKRKLYRCRFNYALSKLIVDNGFDDLWRMENPDSSEFTRYNRSSSTKFRIRRVYTDIKFASNTKINHIIIPFTDHYNVSFIDRFPSKAKIWKKLVCFHNSLLCKPEFSSALKTFLFLIRNTKNNHSPASG